MARLTSAQRVQKGAVFLDRRKPGWFRDLNPDEIDIYKQNPDTFKALLFWATKGLKDTVSEEFGFTVPSFDADSQEEYAQKREAFAKLLSAAWKVEISSRLATCPEKPQPAAEVNSVGTVSCSNFSLGRSEELLPAMAQP